MRKLTFISLLLLSFISASAQTWSPLVSGTNRNLHDVTIASNHTIYAISSVFYGDKEWGMNDILLRSFDNGNTWDSTLIDGFGQSIYFLNDSVGYLSGGMPSCGMAATVLKTADRGLTWNAWSSASVWSVPMSVMMGYSAAYFWNADNGYVFGGSWGAEQFTTQDNGANWTNTHTFKCQDSYPSIFFLNQMNGYLVSDSVTTLTDSLGNILSKTTIGYIYKTTNGGVNWSMQAFPNDSVSDVHFPSQNIGYVAAGSHLLKTTNAGTTWAMINLPFSAVKLGFMTDAIGYVIAKDGNIYKTTNGGISWILDYTGNFLAIDVNRGRAFAVGKNGSIVRLDAATIGITEANTLLPFQIFPNPSSNFLQIVANQIQNFSIELFNAAGQLLLQEKGKNAFSLNLQSLPAQTYFLQIKDEKGKIVQTEKVLKE